MDYVKLIPEEDWESLRGYYEHDLNSVLPDYGKAKLPAIIEDDELLAFCTCERFLRCDQFWVAPQYRGTAKASSLIRRLADYLFNAVPDGSSGVIIASNENQERLFKRMGFVEVPGKLFSINKDTSRW
jgi:hypothetical protein